ncbi:MAG: hypothetical protein EBS79_02940 [Gammaproteobacteria bacterium]|jgi:hypothetical protein|nr:hypothetical protein [Gammaproteobacteria bacterium]NBY23171.1 hypothetical protein [Gammaproteobacteria bacterium]NDE33515.1 hypothetical protein [Gammaproteobacteria bacterium]NDE55489.1 hypothetical protein [Gammaproteobacteria bacterium]NDG86566.1 hypothetical protein [Gammaproteobacteria bacterium]
MAEKTAPKPRSTRPTVAKPTPKASPSPETADAPDLNAILAWLHTVDDWSLAGYKNRLPRWVYIAAAVLLLT